VVKKIIAGFAGEKERPGRISKAKHWTLDAVCFLKIKNKKFCSCTVILALFHRDWRFHQKNNLSNWIPMAILIHFGLVLYIQKNS
jgi:hypothetical protein